MTGTYGSEISEYYVVFRSSSEHDTSEMSKRLRVHWITILKLYYCITV